MAKTERNRKIFLNLTILGIVILSFLSCSINSEKQEVQNNETYYIIKQPKPNSDSINIIKAPKYGNHNFLLSYNNRIYYHTKYLPSWCGMDEDDSQVLLPQELIEIKFDSLSFFLKNLVKDKNYEASIFTISSHTDTIKNPAFTVIYDYIKSNKIKRYLIRKWNTEEKHAIKIKLKDTIK